MPAKPKTRLRFTRSSSPRAAVVITVSDRCARGEREDLSGPRVAALLARHGFEVVATALIPDRKRLIVHTLRAAAAAAALVVTTGGTGLGPRDVTPEATQVVVDRLAPGLSEAMRATGAARERRAWLSRGLAGVRGRSLIVNLPGSPAGAEESLASILDLLPHALAVLSGGNAHPDVPAANGGGSHAG